jgi:multicomponent Na+:H+ antiporter subunit A
VNDRSLILDTSLRVIYHPVLVLSLYLLFAGHNQPGGGFVGGLVAGAAISLRFIAGGIDELRAAVILPPWWLIGAGLAVASLTALAPLALGGAVLESGIVEWTLPLLGKVKSTSALVFDIGVYLVVAGLVLMMFEAFGERAVDPATLPPSGTDPDALR